LEASALTHASQRGLLARRSPLLKLQGDAKLIAMARSGNTGAFETIVDRYQARLLGFCRQMLKSTEDAEDVLQEVFVNAYRAMLADEREINLRPWLYRIARNRCLNHLRKPTADAQESMDMVPVVEAASTAEKVSNREEFRQLLTDVGKLPETQRTALLLREMDAMSYEEIAATMETSVPSVKSLLVRARIALAEASQARQLTCGEVRLELAEASEGLRKVSGPVRRHVRDCDECSDFRAQVRSTDKAMAALFPAGALVALKGFILGKLGLGGASGGASAGATGGAGAAGAGATATAGAGAGATAAATATATGAGAVGGVGAALGGGGAAGGIGAVGGAIGTKAVAGVVTAAVITAGAVEVNQNAGTSPLPKTNPPAKAIASSVHRGPLAVAPHQVAPTPAEPVELTVATATEPAADPAPVPVEEPVPVEDSSGGTEAGGKPATEEGDPKATAKAGAPKITAAKSPPAAAGAPTGAETVVVTVGGGAPPAEGAAAPQPESPSPPAESSPPPSNPPASEPPAKTTAPPPPATSGSSEEGEAEAEVEAPAAPSGDAGL